QSVLKAAAIFFFFQAEDGIRDKLVTGVQTCALPIFPVKPNASTRSASRGRSPRGRRARPGATRAPSWARSSLRRAWTASPRGGQIGRAACRERVGGAEWGGVVHEESGKVRRR